MTEPERILWARLRKRQLRGYRFRRQFSVEPYILDFYSPRLRLAIEIDGSHHQQIDQQEYDFQRTDYPESFGIMLIRFTNQKIYEDIQQVIDNIIQMVDSINPD